MKTRQLLPIVITTALLGACANQTELPHEGSEPASSETQKVQTNAEDSQGDSAEQIDSETAADHEGEQDSFRIVEFGYGHDEWSGQAIVIVTAGDESAVGEFVTASVNFHDETGAILTTEEQVESFSWAGQHLVLPVGYYFDGDGDINVESIDPSVSISNYNARQAPRDPLPVLSARSIEAGDYGGYTTVFEYTNETDKDLEHLRVGVVCRDDDGEIIGGNSTYPSLAPKGKAISFDTDIIVAEEPATCEAHLNYGD